MNEDLKFASDELMAVYETIFPEGPETPDQRIRMAQLAVDFAQAAALTRIADSLESIIAPLNNGEHVVNTYDNNRPIYI